MKYIIYKTTNLVNGKIYIGYHQTETPDEFDGYLGCGVNLNFRRSLLSNRTPIQKAIKKYGPENFKRETLQVLDTLEEARAAEAAIVTPEFLKRADTYNAALGGQGCSDCGRKTVCQYSLDGFFIKEWYSINTAAREFKCSGSCIGKVALDKTPSLGYLWSENRLECLDLSEYHIDENKEITYLYDKNGIFIKAFVSQTEYAKYIQSDQDVISTAIKGCYTCNGYYISNTKYEVYPIPKKHTTNDKIYEYDLEGKFVKEWENSRAVYKAFNINTYQLSTKIRLHSPYLGHLWSYEKHDFIDPVTPQAHAPKRVGKFTKDGELVKTFNTVTEAKKDTCGAPLVLRGSRKSAGGYIFKYVD